MTELQILTGMRDLIARGWVQGPWAVDKEGNSCRHDHPDAVAWCIAGASYRFFEIDVVTWIRARQRIDDLLPEFHSVSPAVTFNEVPRRTQAEVLALLDRAIGQCVAEESQQTEPEPAREVVEEGAES